MGRRVASALLASLSIWLSACGARTSVRATATAVARVTSTAVASVSPDRLGPVAAGFEPVSASVLNDQVWWLFGERPCSRKECVAIVRTTDGGRTFVAIPAPAVRYEIAGCPYVAVSALAFADARNGYAYGCRLYVTHDRGMRWRAIDLGGYVTDVVTRDGKAYAVVSAPNGTSRLVRSATTRDDWATLRTGESPVAVSVLSSAVFVATNSSQLLISHDQGNAFSRNGTLGFGPPSTVQPVTRSVIWAFCSGGMMGHVLRSANGGHSFRLVQGGTEGAGASGEYHAAVFAAASASTAVVGFGQLLRTTDAGRSYERVGPRGQQWTFLAFSDPTHGVALAGPPFRTPPANHLYVTANAGRTFALIAFPPG